MKKTISFDKKIEFPTMIGEISAISLEKNLSFIDEANIGGDLLLQGRYKMTEASRLEEEFKYKIPMEIALSEKLDLSTTSIDIKDFSYDILNDDVMNCHIELSIEGLEKIDEVEERECDGDSMDEKEIELPTIEKTNNRSDEDNDVDNNINKEEVEEVDLEKIDDDSESLFFNFKEDSETYGTFLVYIVRQNETVNTILEKYHTSLEELEKYNDLKDISNGSKLIIPLVNE